MYSNKVVDHGTPLPAGAATVTVQIDGTKVTVPAGTSVLRAAVDAGVKIPKLCATDSLDAFGSCRLCLVEVEGRKGHRPTCARTAAGCAGSRSPRARTPRPSSPRAMDR